MSNMTRATFPESLKVGMRKWIMDGVRQTPNYLPFVAESIPTTKAYEYENDYAGFTDFEETAENGPTPYEAMTDGYKTVFTPTQYMKGTQVSWAAVKDDLYDSTPIRKRAMLIGQSWVRTQNKKFFGMFNKGFNTAYTSYGDKLPMFSTLHTVPSAAFTQSNASSTGAILNNSNLEAGILQMQTVKDFNGEREERGSNTIILMVPPQLRQKALEITASERIPYEISNTINIHFGNMKREAKSIVPGSNAYNSMKYDLQVLVNPYIDADAGGSDTAWFLIEKGFNELRHFVRQSLIIKEEEDFDSWAYKLSSMGRFTNGWGGWKSLSGSKGDAVAYSS